MGQLIASLWQGHILLDIKYCHMLREAKILHKSGHVRGISGSRCTKYLPIGANRYK